jgi:hypothetical protein
LFIDNELWEEQKMLLDDYKEEMKADKSKRLKTIADLNNSIMSKYKQLLDRDSMAKRQNRLLKFKK